MFSRLWKSMERLLVAAGTIVVIAALGLVLAALVPSYVGYESLIVYGGSMAPFLRLGDVAVIQPASPEDLRVGDIVTYRSPTNPRALVTHRIMRIKTQDGALAFETKGDASPNVDYWSVSGDTVVGRVVYKVPFVGYVFDFAKGLPGRLFLLGLPALLLVIETSRRKHAHPPLDNRPISRVDEQPEHQQVIYQTVPANAPPVLAICQSSLTWPGGVPAQATPVDQVAQAISVSTGDHQQPLGSESRGDHSPPISWLHPIELHPIEEKPPHLRALSRLLLCPVTPSDRWRASEADKF